MFKGTLSVCGPTQSGKSTLIYHLIKHRDAIFSAKFKRIILCISAGSCPQHQKYIEKVRVVCPDLELVEGLPDPTQQGLTLNDDHKLLIIGEKEPFFLFQLLNFSPGNYYLILDDMITRVVNSEPILDIFLKHSHHSNISCSKISAKKSLVSI